MVRMNYMGRVTCEAKVENALDAARARMGEIPASGVRSVPISDALIHTGTSMLALPTSMLRQLGLGFAISDWVPRSINRSHEAKLYGPVWLTVLGRDITLDALEVEDGCPVLIGQIPLEHLQLVVDMTNHRLAHSPANGGEWILDMF